MSERMTKMTAIGHLCEIRRELERDLESLEKRLVEATTDDDPRMKKFYREEIEQKKAWVRALEMAGTAMTR